MSESGETEKSEVVRPNFKIGTPHVYWDVATSGYEREGQTSAQVTRLKFARDKFTLRRAPNACFGEIEADTEGQYLVRMPTQHAPNQVQSAETSMRTTIMSAKDRSVEKCTAIEDRIRKDQLKHRREVVQKQLRELEYEMSGGRAGYEANRRETGLRPLIEDETGGMHGSIGRKPFVATEMIGTTAPGEFNEFNGTGLPEPDWGKFGMKSTLEKFPNLRTKSSLPRMPGVGFA